MGQILDSPITTKRTSVHEKFLGDDKLKWVVTDMQGWRDTMEDTHVCEVVSVGESDNNKQELGIFAVFDGHFGDATAKFIASRFVDVASSHITNNSDDLQKAMEDTYLDLDEEWRKKEDPKKPSGSTAVSVVITPTHYIVANAGDSRLIIVRDDEVVLRTTDHKTEDAVESARIRKAGKSIDRHGYIDGRLRVSRALGDFDKKNVKGLKAVDQPVSPLPTVQIYPRNKKDQFLAICCDGIWEVMASESATTFLLSHMRAGYSLADCAELMLDHCLDLDSKDNMTCMLLALEGAPPEIGNVANPPLSPVRRLSPPVVPVEAMSGHPGDSTLRQTAGATSNPATMYKPNSVKSKYVNTTKAGFHTSATFNITANFSHHQRQSGALKVYRLMSKLQRYV